MEENPQTEKDPLDDLFGDEQQINREMLRDLVLPYAQLTLDGKIMLKPTSNDLTLQKKILVILLAQKALSIKLGTEEYLGPDDIMKISGDPGGSIRPTLAKLVRDERLIATSDRGQYYIPAHILLRVREVLTNGK